MPLLIFLPQKVQGYAMALLQLLVDVGKIRDQAGAARRGWGWIKGTLKECVTVIVWNDQVRPAMPARLI